MMSRHLEVRSRAGAQGSASLRLVGREDRKPGACATLAVVLAMCGAGAFAAEWPRLLGPADNATSPETRLLRELPKAGPRVVWEAPKGNGFGGPAIVGDRVVIFTGARTARWSSAGMRKPGSRCGSTTTLRRTPRYGGSTGPRTSPVIADGRVFTFGISGQLRCLDLASGKVVWERDAAREFRMGPAFFGYGSTPLVLGSRLIVLVGGKLDGKPVNTVALDAATGKTVWAAEHEWGASYASPIPAKLHGRECVLVFAGGESRPPTGGLLVIDAADGKVLAAGAHRADVAESVSASSPVVVSAEEEAGARVCLGDV